MPWNLEISLSANSETGIELQDSHVKLEEKKCGDYFVCDKWPKSTKSPSKEIEVFCVKKHCHVHTGPQCQSPFPFTSVLRGLWLWLKHSCLMVTPKQLFTPPKGLWERAVSWDCSQQTFELWGQSLKLLLALSSGYLWVLYSKHDW